MIRFDKRMLTPAEVGQALGVDPKTVTRWAQQGRLTAIHLPARPGGKPHRRYRADDIEAILNGTNGGQS